MFLRDSCGARNYLFAVAHIISTAAPLLTSLYLPQAALSRKAVSSATPAYLILLLIFTCRELTGNKCTVVTQPKSGVSANFTTPAYSISLLNFTCRELAGNKCTVMTQPKSRASASCVIFTSLPDYSLSFFSSTKTIVRICSVEVVLRCLTVQPSSRRLLSILGSTRSDLPLPNLFTSDNIITFFH